MDHAIDIANLGKQYALGNNSAPYRTLRDTLMQIGKRENKPQNSFWALQDINLQIPQGERLGIIGRNGAGKSTLLKLISRITHPTTGTIKLRGRVTSLLEVGTGFHPELTGRENIFLNGAVMGMQRHEIRRKFDEIVDFAGVEQFLDTPVKRYSSGMYTRLAFAVAAHLESEILIVDEVLAVGDAQFQKKCLGKMEEVGKREGRTVLFVSHNMHVMQSFCQNCVVLERGRIVKQGSSSECVNYYINDLAQNRGPEMLAAMTATKDDPTVEILDFKVMQDDQVTEIADSAKPVQVIVDYRLKQADDTLLIAVDLCNDFGDVILRSFFDKTGNAQNMTPGVYRSTMTLPPHLLGPKHYVLGLRFDLHRKRHVVEPVKISWPLEVVHRNQDILNYYTSRIFTPALDMHFDWRTEQQETA